MTKKTDLLLSQYELMVNSSLEVSNWRQTANNFYLSANTVLVGILAYFQGIAFRQVIAVTGVLICLNWLRTIQSHKQLNSAKFEVIQEMEKKLPIRMFALEEMHYKKDGRLDFTIIERITPLIFILFYVILFFIYTGSLFQFCEILKNEALH